jgi:hypothetical protein
MSIILFVLIVGGMFSFAIMKQRELKEELVPQTPAAEEVPVRYPEVTRIDAKHFFVDGVHTLVGEVELPTPCDLLEASAIVAESYPEQVTISFNVINTAEFCAQVRTKQRFSVPVPASEGATFAALFMGRSVPLNLIPPEPGETPEQFELFIKG